MRAGIYSYNTTDNGYDLYLGGYSIIEGLQLINPLTPLVITTFGATGYQQFGWATEQELPMLQKVIDVVTFLTAEGDIGIMEFEARIDGIGLFTMDTPHGCHYRCDDKGTCLSIFKAATPSAFSGLILHKAITNPGRYIACSTDRGSEHVSLC